MYVGRMFCEQQTPNTPSNMQEIDLKNPKTNTKNAGFTKEEREGFSTLLEQGFVDTFRLTKQFQKSEKDLILSLCFVRSFTK